jgi:hypothetical protein
MKPFVILSSVSRPFPTIFLFLINSNYWGLFCGKYDTYFIFWRPIALFVGASCIFYIFLRNISPEISSLLFLFAIFTAIIDKK